MSRQKSSQNSENQDEFNVIFDQETDHKAIEAKIKKKTTRTRIIAAVVAVALFGGYGLHLLNKRTNADYIEGNYLRLAIGDGEPSESQTVANPWKESTLTSMLTYRSLFGSNVTFVDITPELAEKCEELDDGLTYIITMKEGEKWSDGTPITVEDVVFSLETFLLCDDVNNNMLAAFNLISGAEAWKNGETDSLTGLSVDGNQLTIQLDYKYNLFDIMLTQFVPLPKHKLESVDPATITSGIEFFQNENPVCSGMYLSTGLDADSNLVLERNPHYTDSTSEIDKIILYWDYKHKDIDYYSTTYVTDMASYRSVKELKEYPINVYSYHYFAFNMDADYEIPAPVPLLDGDGNPLVDEDGEAIFLPGDPVEYGDDRPANEATMDVRVRQAINHAIDIDQLFQDVYLESGLRCYAGSMTRGTEAYPYNPALSIQLLEEVGYDFNRPFRIIYDSTDTNTLVFLQNVAEDLEAVGFTVELVLSTGEEQLYETRDYDMMLKVLTTFNIEGWYNEYLHNNEQMSNLFETNDTIDKLVNQMNNTVDGTTYISLLEQLVELEQTFLYKIPLFVLDQAVFIDTNRLQLPEDMQFPNIKYRADIRFDEWTIKKG